MIRATTNLARLGAVLLVVAVAAAGLAGCDSGDGTADTSVAGAAKKRVDGVVRDLLAATRPYAGADGEVPARGSGGFTRCGLGGNSHQYVARVTITGTITDTTPLDDAARTAALRSALTDAGFAVTDRHNELVGTDPDGASVSVAAAVEPAKARGSWLITLTVDSACTKYDDADAELADDTEPVDYSG